MCKPITSDLDGEPLVCDCGATITADNLGELFTHDNPDDCCLGCVYDAICESCLDTGD